MSGFFWLLKVLAEFARDLWGAGQAKLKDRQRQHELRVQKAEQAIAKRDADGVTLFVDDHLRWLQNNGQADRGGPGAAKN